MKSILIILLLAPGSFYSFAQEPIAAFELPELNILYRGYPNKVKVVVAHCNDQKLILTSANAIVQTSDNSDYYIIKPGPGKSALLKLIMEDSLGIRTEISRRQYRVSNLPDPTLYWGASRSGKKGSMHSRIIMAKYPPEVPLSAQFSVREWTLSFDSLECSGLGSNLTKADSLFKTIQQPTLIQLTAIVVGPDGIARMMNGNWPVDAWKDENPTIKVIGCG